VDVEKERELFENTDVTNKEDLPHFKRPGPKQEELTVFS